MFREADQAPRTLPQNARREDAVFVGWQALQSGLHVALYNITAAGHPSLGSTVTEDGLLKLNLQIPQTPLRPMKEY